MTMPTGARIRLVAVFATLALLAPVVPVSGATSGGWSNLGGAGKGMTGIVLTTLRVGAKLYVGGNFTNAGGVGAADYLAIWNGRAWSAVGAGLGGQVNAIAVVGTDVYAGGAFTNVGGDGAIDHLARWNGAAWRAVGGATFNDVVYALQVADGNLYAGGTFTDADGIAAADGIARFDLEGTAGWEAITTEGTPIANVRTFDVEGDALWVGGGFNDGAGVAAADNLAVFDMAGSSWSARGESGDLNATVLDVTVDGAGGAYIAGDFYDAAGISAADKIAHWTGSAWEALPGGGGDLGDESSVHAYAIVKDSDTIFVVGTFSDAGGDQKRDAIQAVRNGTWRNVGTGFYGGPVSQGPFYTATVLGNAIVAGGVPTDIGDNELANYIASFRIRQPDATIAVGMGNAVGNNVYNTNASKQTVNADAGRGSTKSFTIKIANDGFVTDGMKVKGAESGNGFTISYFAGATNVTSEVVAGTYTLAAIAPGQARQLTLKVKVGSSVAIGATKAVLVKATSTGLGKPADAVKAVVKVA